jgi:hypothetical protein
MSVRKASEAKDNPHGSDPDFIRTIPDRQAMQICRVCGRGGESYDLSAIRRWCACGQTRSAPGDDALWRRRIHFWKGDQNHEVLVTALLERVGAALSCQQDVTCNHVVNLAIEDVTALSAEDVVDLVMGVLVQADARAVMQDALAEIQGQAWCIFEIAIRRGFAVAAVRAGLDNRRFVSMDDERWTVLLGKISTRSRACAACGIAHDIRGQGRVKLLPFVDDETGNSGCTLPLQMRVVGHLLLGNMHVVALRGFVAKCAQPIHAALVEIDQTELLAPGQVAHGLGIDAMCIEQLAMIEDASREWCDQDWCGSFLARDLDVAQQPTRKIGVRLGVACWIFDLLVVVTKLDEQHVTFAQLASYRIECALFDEAA